VKILPLTQGLNTSLDDEDIEWANQWKWYAKRGGNSFYAYRNSAPNLNGTRDSLLLHRELFRRINPDFDTSMEIDHRDGNGLNNQRENLRSATDSKQRHNQTIRTNNTSGFLGVTWNKAVGKFSARVRLNWKRKHVGWFNCPVEAAKARDAAARELHGPFGTYNFPREGERPARA
jgi:hypothetical protein